MDNYPDFLSGKAMNATSSTLELGVGATKRCIEEWQGDPSRIGLLIAPQILRIKCSPALPPKSWERLTDFYLDQLEQSACKRKAVRCC